MRENCDQKRSGVPQLINNKRRHLEKKLSSAQQKKLILKESKEDAQFPRDLYLAM